MNINDYINNISFRTIPPDSPASGIDELENTILPEEDEAMKQRLSDLCRIPKMSTFAVGAIINKAVSEMPDNQAYVNVGVWHGFTLLAGMIGNKNKRCIGVDNFSLFGSPRREFLERFDQHKSRKHLFYDMDYARFFRRFRGQIGFYFYDGEHSYDHQLNGLQLGEPFFADNCIIMIDDTNWDEPRKATLDFIENSSHEYHILLDAPTFGNFHPTFWNGLILLQKGGS